MFKHPAQPHVVVGDVTVLEFARIVLPSCRSWARPAYRRSLGVMANDGRRAFRSSGDHPRIAISVALAVNFLAPWLRAVSDPIEREALAGGCQQAHPHHAAGRA